SSGRSPVADLPVTLLLAAEIDGNDVRAVLIRANGLLAAAFRLAFRRVVFGLFVRGGFDVGDSGVELQPEVDRRVDEGRDCREGNLQLGRDLVEAQSDLEAVIVDRQIPELVLQDDRHLVREALAQMLRYMHVGRAGLEGDVEMVVAGK